MKAIRNALNDTVSSNTSHVAVPERAVKSDPDIHGVIDTDAIILQRLKDLFERGERATLEKKYNMKFSWSELNVVIDPCTFRLVAHDPQYHISPSVRPVHPDANKDSGKDASEYVLYRTVLTNRTSFPQEYSLDVSRTTKSSWNVSVLEGVRRSLEFHMNIKAPEEILEIGGGFQKELEISKEGGQGGEEEVSWSINHTIKVAEDKETIVEVKLTDVEYKGSFEQRVDLEGCVIGTVYKGSLCLCRIVVRDLRGLFPKDKGFSCDDAGIVYKLVRGRCNFRCGVDQRVTLTERPIENL